jgi:thiol-disulfide isomerase/thioredoxin
VRVVHSAINLIAMRLTIVLTAVGLLLAAAAPAGDGGRGAARPAEADVDPPSFTWHRDDGNPAWSARLAPSVDAADEPGAQTGRLHARPWFPSLTPIEAELIDGGSVRLEDFAGKVLLLDFWASWCTPCVEQLPRLQQLRDARRADGLEVLTFNVAETDEVARRFASAHDVTLPIARGTRSIAEEFRVSGLPTVIVADREGRIRARFGSFPPGADRKIEQLCRSLLEETPDPGPEIARVVKGGGLLDVRWSRVASGSVRGLALLREADGPEPRILAATGWEVVGYDPDGKQLLSRRAGPGVDVLRSFASTRRQQLFGFRPASDRVVPVALDGETGEAWQAPARVFDLRVEPGQDDAPPTVLLATVSGLYRVGFGGEPIDAREDLGLVVQVAGAEGGPIVLGGDGRVSWLARDLRTLREWQAPTGSRRLVKAPDPAEGVGLGPAEVVAVAAGNLLADGALQVAVAAADRLLVVELDSGRVRFRARWPGIAALVAGDLNDDGRDELIVGSGKRVTVLASL